VFRERRQRHWSGRGVAPGRQAGMIETLEDGALRPLPIGGTGSFPGRLARRRPWQLGCDGVGGVLLSTAAAGADDARQNDESAKLMHATGLSAPDVGPLAVGGSYAAAAVSRQMVRDG